VGTGQITLADRWWQLQQHFERWFVRAERQQSPVEREHEHWLLFRLPFEPGGGMFTDILTVQGKGKGSVSVLADCQRN